MKVKKFIELLDAVGDFETQKINDILNKITKREKDLYFTTDSRDVKENAVFIAIKGENTDGHYYVNDCFDNGAAISVVEAYGDYNGFCIKTDDCVDFINQLAVRYYSEIKPYTIALTGSNGKTTTKEWIYSLLKTYYDEKELYKNPGNLNSEIGLPIGLLNGLNEKKKVAVLEMGMAKENDIEYLSDLYRPDFSILLNIGTAHIGNTGSLDNTYREKCKILKKDIPGLINISDKTIIKNLNDSEVNKKGYYFGLYKDFQVDYSGTFLKACHYTLNPDRETFVTEFSVLINNAEKKISFERELRLDGLYHKGFLLNLCAAISMVYALQKNIFFLDYIHEAISPIQGRFNLQSINDNVLINDFYNSSIESLEYALETMVQMKGRGHFSKIICVLGSIAETGTFSPEIHEHVGELLNQYEVDEVLLFTKDREIELISRKFNKNKLYSDNNEIIASEIIDRIKNENNVIYLFKASRSIQLEEVYENVLESFS